MSTAVTERRNQLTTAAGQGHGVQFERMLIFTLSVVWVLGIVIARVVPTGAEATSVDFGKLLMYVMFGPLAINYLFTGETNKLTAITIALLVLASSRFWQAKSGANQIRWGALGVLAVLGTHRVFRHSSKFITLPHVVFAIFVVMAMVSTQWAVRLPTFTFQKSISLFFLMGATFWYCFDRYDTIPMIRSGLNTIARIAVGYAIVSAPFIVSSAGYLEGRLRAFSENPNTLGGFMALTARPILYKVTMAWRKSPSVLDPRVLWYGGALVGAVLLTFLSGSRAGILSFAVSGAVFVLISHRQYFFNIMLVMIPLAALFLVGVPGEKIDYVQAELQQAEGAGDGRVVAHLTHTSASGRFEAWETAVGFANESPWLGKGFGVTRFLFMEIMERYGFREHHGAHAHNSYLELALELGYPMAGLFVIMLLVLPIRCWKIAAKERSYEYRVMLAALLGCYCAGLFNAIWESWMIAAGSFAAFIFWMVAALVLGVGRADAAQAHDDFS